MSKTFLLDQLLPADSVALSRLVLSVRYPDQDYFDTESALSIPGGETFITTQHAEKFTHAASEASASGFHAFVTALLSGSRNTSDSTKFELSAALCVTRQLTNSAAFFRQLVDGRTSAQTWLERAATRRQHVFLVTGIKTVTDATVSAEKASGAGASADLQLPVTAAAAAAGGGLPILAGDALDVKVGLSVERSAEERTAFLAPGERVFAVQYRRIRFSWFRHLQLDTARLDEGVRWNMFLGVRGSGGEGDVVEAKTDVIGEDQMAAEGPYQQVDLEGEEFVFPNELDVA